MSDTATRLADDSGFTIEEATLAVRYLKKFGYLTDDNEESVPDAIRSFQSAFDIAPTGALNRDTLRDMTLPRCGLPDNMVLTEEARWRQNNLTYYVDAYAGGISNADQDDLMKVAWDNWARVANLSFTRVNNKNQANIVVSAGRGRQSGFDGPYGTLAWANLPQGDGRQLLLVMDLDETWVKSLSQGQRGILFLNVFAHEGGHTLGLDHTNVRGALMYPTYSPSVPKPQQNDDVARIVNLYGPPSSPPPPPEEGGKEYVIRVRGTLTIDGRQVPDTFGIMV